MTIVSIPARIVSIPARIMHRNAVCHHRCGPRLPASLTDQNGQHQRPQEQTDPRTEDQSPSPQGKGVVRQSACLIGKLRDLLEMFGSNVGVVRSESLQRPIAWRFGLDLHLSGLRKKLFLEMSRKTDQHWDELPLARPRFHQPFQLSAHLRDDLLLLNGQLRPFGSHHHPSEVFIKLSKQSLILQELPKHPLLRQQTLADPMGVKPGEDMGHQNGSKYRSQSERDPSAFLFLEHVPTSLKSHPRTKTRISLFPRNSLR